MGLTPFLSEVIRATRAYAQRYWSDSCTYCIRNSWDRNSQTAGLWFRTKGCTWASKGSCLVCNYSSGPNTTSEQIIDYVKNGMKEFDEKLTYLLISPSGSMLDSNEVPIKARDEIIKILASTLHDGFGFETRPETINREIIENFQAQLNGRLKRVLLGIETVNRNYQRFCLNKELDQSICINSFRILTENNVSPVPNILIGLPFLTEKENISAAIESISWSIDHGAAYCYLFPVHIKDGTPLRVLYDKGHFRPPSLWALIEVMRYLEERCHETLIRPSWYTSLGAYNVVESPYTCNKCFKKVVELFDHYDRWLDIKSLDKLFNFKCSCRDKWRENADIEDKNKPAMIERIFEGYRIIADEANIPWEMWEDKIIYELNLSFSSDKRHGSEEVVYDN
ncbi:tRNA-2-methylthio-N(6)-dimethylallyladenosine synthase [Maridesulfovibrio hydrothermalis]|uniref:Putative Elongator protein 3/MiaB/NifB n=1 Tax=Maridesulfovibrio hydrothermalis AM13 = DSM 14728 TaxID=1121451 RepID=L0R6G4_9BACT|nr:tRNA-2-methylthio-N(6)-dimethylallyladenosine synthase [Maridesulfovibrio hydrothermalis]CCO22298.1 putative Elongator protein 3/MiaB/NifB [Maridesulfovibrio hydrothermalis AM13 = DSM 14728]